MARASVKRHAQAVFSIALERDELDGWLSDLRRIAQAMAEPQLIAMLETPRLRLSDKTRLLDEVLGGISPLAMNLAYLLVARGRLGIAGKIASEYQRLVNEHRGIQHVEVTTAIPLDDEDRKRLKDRLEAVTDREIVLSAEVDPEIIGGIVARLGDRLIDGSTRSKLKALRRSLIEAGPT